MQPSVPGDQLGYFAVNRHHEIRGEGPRFDLRSSKQRYLLTDRGRRLQAGLSARGTVHTERDQEAWNTAVARSTASLA